MLEVRSTVAAVPVGSDGLAALGATEIRLHRPGQPGLAAQSFQDVDDFAIHGAGGRARHPLLFSFR
jgi:hypothetical protein